MAMTNRWFTDMALLRISPDTEILAGQLHVSQTTARRMIRDGHLAGCPCGDCWELRDAAAMTAKEQGERAAAPEPAGPRIRHPEGCRCQDCSDLRQAGDCTCSAPAWRPGSPRWAAHNTECPMRARLCREGATRAVREQARVAVVHEPGCGCGCEKPGRLTPALEIRAELEAFDDWMLRGGPQYPDELAHPERAPAGHCTGCHLGLAVSGGRCFWCQLALNVANENRGTEALAKHGPDHAACPCRGCRRRDRLRGLYFVMLAWVAIVTTVLVAAGKITIH